MTTKKWFYLARIVIAMDGTALYTPLCGPAVGSLKLFTTSALALAELKTKPMGEGWEIRTIYINN